MRKHRLIGLFAVGVIAAFGLVIPNTAANAAAPLQVTTTSLPSVYSGVKYPTTKLKASGGTSFLGTYTWSVVAGELPNGLVLSSGGQLSGTTRIVVFGNNTNPAGVYSFTVQVKDLKNVVATMDLSITLKPWEITTTSLPNAKRGQLYFSTVKIAGACASGVSWKWSAAPAQPLPEGLAISTQGTITGVAKRTGVSTVLIKATCDPGGIPFITPRAEKTFTLTVS